MNGTERQLAKSPTSMALAAMAASCLGDEPAELSTVFFDATRRPVRAELVWDGKYDADGRRVAPLCVAATGE